MTSAYKEGERGKSLDNNRDCGPSDFPGGFLGASWGLLGGLFLGHSLPLCDGF